MMKVKILINKEATLLERDINEFLVTIGSNRHMKIDLVDIKLSSISLDPNNVSLVSMVIYNETTIN